MIAKSDEIPLTPAARFWWEASGSVEGFNHYMVIRTPAALEFEHLKKIFTCLMETYDALRLRLVESADLTAKPLRILPPERVNVSEWLHLVDTRGFHAEERRTRVAEEIPAAVRRISAESGNVVHGVWFDAGSGEPGRLLLVMSHLVTDSTSWRIILQDMSTAWHAIRNGDEPTLHGPDVSLREWAHYLAGEAESGRRLKEIILWEENLKHPEPFLATRPLDPAIDTFRSGRQLTVVLSPARTSALLDVAPDFYGCQTREILLASFVLAVTDWRSRNSASTTDSVLVRLEGRGLHTVVDGMDLSRTVGWLTNLVSVRLDLGGIDPTEAWMEEFAVRQIPGEILKQLSRLPDNGIGFGVLRYLREDTGKMLRTMDNPQVAFNYLGHFPMDSREDWAPDATWNLLGSFVPLDAPAPHVLQCSSYIRDEGEGPVLTSRWIWGEELLKESDMRDLTETWERALRLFVDQAAPGGEPEFETT